MKKKQHLNEVNINGSIVYIENGDVKVKYSDKIEADDGYISPEELKQILLAEIEMIYELG